MIEDGTVVKFLSDKLRSVPSPCHDDVGGTSTVSHYLPYTMSSLYCIGHNKYLVMAGNLISSTSAFASTGS